MSTPCPCGSPSTSGYLLGVAGTTIFSTGKPIPMIQWGMGYLSASISFVAPAWNSGTSYTTGQFASTLGSDYVALQNSTNQNPSTATTYWAPAGPIIPYSVAPNPIITVLNFTGFSYSGPFVSNWSASKAYLPNQVVQFGGGVYYLCLLANTNIQPTNATYWQLIGPSQFVIPLGVNWARFKTRFQVGPIPAGGSAQQGLVRIRDFTNGGATNNGNLDFDFIPSANVNDIHMIQVTFPSIDFQTNAGDTLTFKSQQFVGIPVTLQVCEVHIEFGV